MRVVGFSSFGTTCLHPCCGELLCVCMCVCVRRSMRRLLSFVIVTCHCPGATPATVWGSALMLQPVRWNGGGGVVPAEVARQLRDRIKVCCDSILCRSDQLYEIDVAERLSDST